MRGKATTLGFYSENGGITPAHAGKSTSFGDTTFIRLDHPRTCGEK